MMKHNHYLNAANAHRVQRELDLFYAQKNHHTAGRCPEEHEEFHNRSTPLRIQILSQVIHQLEWTSAVDHLVDQIAFAARKLLDHAFRRGPDGFVCSMDTCREQQHERGVSEVHGKTQ